MRVAYSVFDVSVTPCASCTNDERIIEVKFPNKDNAGGGYECVQGAQYCRSKNSNYWGADDEIH